MQNLACPEEQLYRESWGIKAACGLVKRKGQRKEVSKEPWYNNIAGIFFSFCVLVLWGWVFPGLFFLHFSLPLIGLAL